MERLHVWDGVVIPFAVVGTKEAAVALEGVGGAI